MPKPTRQEKKEREAFRREVKKEFPFPDNGFHLDLTGSNRKRIAIPKAFQPMLTERQRTVLKGKMRQGKGWTRMMKVMEDTGMTMQEFVEQLSVEELIRGKFKNKNGHFTGQAPKWVPREFHQACLRELMRRGREMWERNYLTAIEAMTDIAAGRGAVGEIATPSERLKAAQFVVERMEGKVPERHIITEEKRWETVMDGIVAEVSPEAIDRGRRALESAEDVLDAEVLYEEEPEPEPVPVRRRRRTK